MNQKLEVIVADCSGNITIMVLSPVERKHYREIAQQLLQKKELKGEQVSFVLPPHRDVSAPEMEMCGLEFCGNASRAFALYKASSSNLLQDRVSVTVSGCSSPLTAVITNAESGYTVELEMPIPVGSRSFSAKELSLNKDGLLVSIDGISHLILEDIPPMEDTFHNLKDFIYDEVDPELPAFGVMFCDTVNNLMTPVVYVKDVDTIYFEGSCASGTVAAAFARAEKLPDGTHLFTMQQPEGVLHTTVEKKEGRIEQVTLKGLVTLSDVITVDLS